MYRPKLFISYRREDGSYLARLLYDRLVAKGFIVFYDIESLGSGRFDTRILERIEECDNFILILSPRALDRCVNEDDWVRREITHALKHNKKIIPALMKGFSFPDNLPKDLETIPQINAVPFDSMDFMDARIDKLISFFINAESIKPINPEIAMLLKRVSTFLEYGEWQDADEYCEKILDMDSENAEAYLGKLMAELHVNKKEELKNCKEPFHTSRNYPKILRFADAELKKEILDCIEHIKKRKELERLEAQYLAILAIMNTAETEAEYKEIAEKFASLGKFKDAAQRSKEAMEKADAARKDAIYQKARQSQKFDDIPGLENAILSFQKIKDWRDAKKQIEICRQRIEEIEDRVESIRKDDIYQTACRYKDTNTLKSLETALQWFQKIPNWRDTNELIAFCTNRIREIESAQKEETYAKAAKEQQKDEIPNLRNAIVLFQKITDWRDSKEQIEICKNRISEIEQENIYRTACQYKLNDTIESLEQAIEWFSKIPHWQDAQALEEECRKRIEELEILIRKKKRRKRIIKLLISLLCIGIAIAILINQVIIPMEKNKKYENALALMESERYEKAISAFLELNGYKDSTLRIEQCNQAISYNSAIRLMEEKKYKEAIPLFVSLGTYKDSAEKLEQCLNTEYNAAIDLMNKGRYAEAITYFEALGDYKDSVKKIQDCNTLQNMNQKESDYQKALSLMSEGKYDEAITAFQKLNGYRESLSKIEECRNLKKEADYQQALSWMEEGKYNHALAVFETLGNYKDSAEKAEECKKGIAYNDAVSLMNAGKYEEAIDAFKALNGYKDSAEKITQCESMTQDSEYNRAVSLMNAGKYEEAIEVFTTLGNYKDCTEKIEECRKGIAYNNAVSLMNAGKYEEAINAFKALNGYKDSAEKITQCEAMAQDPEYSRAVSLMNAGKYEEAIEAFTALGNYKDCTEKIEECRKGIAYNDAVSLMESGKYEQAIPAFKALGNYRDSALKIEECTAAVNDKKYSDAVSLMNAGRYEEAISAFKALNGYKDSAAKIAECTAAVNDKKYSDAVSLMNAGRYEEAINAFKALNGYKDSAAKIEQCNTSIKNKKYNDAVSLMNAGKYEEAIAIFETLNGYLDSEEQIKICQLKQVNVGDTITLGQYEQDNNEANGAESIEWIVLAKDGNKVLVISAYGLDSRKYNNVYEDTTWETSSIRAWLNDEFLQSAFTSDQQKQILITDVSADPNPNYSEIDPGNATQDRLFLLSMEQAQTYFSSNAERKCKPTDYAAENGVDVNEYNGHCGYWLRTHGHKQNTAVYVRDDGYIVEYGYNVTHRNYAVRPAMWITLDT